MEKELKCAPPSFQNEMISKLRVYRRVLVKFQTETRDNYRGTRPPHENFRKGFARVEDDQNVSYFHIVCITSFAVFFFLYHILYITNITPSSSLYPVWCCAGGAHARHDVNDVIRRPVRTAICQSAIGQAGDFAVLTGCI